MHDIHAVAATPRLAVRNLSKRFGPIIANDDVSLEIGAGELHCLLGENGAGKSTLSSCFYGLLQPDSGRILIDGEELSLRSPADAIRAGIGMVHQHFVLVDNFSVLENIVVGTGRGWRLEMAQARARVENLCQRYQLQVNLDALAGELSLGEQQWVEIVKALYLDAKLLILDEPTAVLTPQESDRLFAALAQMVADGLSVMLISHKMSEVMQSHRITVLRRGKVAGSVTTREVTQDDLVQMMIGRPLQKLPLGEERGARDTVIALEGISVLGARRRRVLNNVNLTIAAGEILGLAGIAGNGQRELFEAIIGQMELTEGRITVDGEAVAGADMRLSPRDIAAKGVGYIPEDRFKDGLIADFSLAENLVLGRQRDATWRKGLLLDKARMRAQAEEAIDAYDIVAPGPEAIVRRLSGGNAQKVILAREMAKATRCLLCNQPTRGLDVGVVEYVLGQLLKMRSEGVAILLASEDLDDLIAVCDRIAVIFRGEIMTVLDREEAELRLIGRLMAGHREGASQ